MVDRFMRGKRGAGATSPEADVAQVAEVRAEEAVQIVDVREPDEWTTGHIPGAVHIPLGQLAARQQELDSAQPVITVCRSGNRSLVAADQLVAAGFRDVQSLAGGMKAWTAAGQPVER